MRCRQKNLNQSRRKWLTESLFPVSPSSGKPSSGKPSSGRPSYVRISGRQSSGPRPCLVVTQGKGLPLKLLALISK